MRAYLDESIRGSRYLICATTCIEGELSPVRTALRSHLKAGQHRLHFVSESDRRRKTILDQIAELQIVSMLYVTKDGNERAARARLLVAAAQDLESAGCDYLTIESRENRDHLDRQVLYGVLGAHPKVCHQHLAAAAEPLLWIPDAIAWAYGRGGEWAQRLDRLGLIGGVRRIEAP